MMSNAMPSRHAVSRLSEKSRYFVHHHIDGRLHHRFGGLNSGSLKTAATVSRTACCEMAAASWSNSLMSGSLRRGGSEPGGHQLDVVAFLADARIVIEQHFRDHDDRKAEDVAEDAGELHQQRRRTGRRLASATHQHHAK